MADTPITAWDADGKPVQPSGSISIKGPTAWDASGNAVNHSSSSVSIPTESQAAANPPKDPGGENIGTIRKMNEEGQRALDYNDVDVQLHKASQSPTPVSNAVTAEGIASAIPEVGPKIVEGIKNLIPSTERAAQTMQGLRKAVGSHPIEVTNDLSKTLSRYQELVDNGNSASSAANKLVRRLTDPAKADLTYNEARDFTTKLGELTADEQSRLSPTMKRQIDAIRVALRQSTANTAERAGKLDEFVQSNNEYHAAKKLQSVVDWAKDFSIKGIAQKAGATGFLYELRKLLGD